MVEPRTVLQLQYLQVVIRLHLGIYLMTRTAVFRGTRGIPRPDSAAAYPHCKNCQLRLDRKRTNQFPSSMEAMIVRARFLDRLNTLFT
jgi:hypothetical protein